MTTTSFYNDLILDHWDALNRYLLHNRAVVVSKTKTRLAAVIAVTRYGVQVEIDPAIWQYVEKSAEIVHGILQGRKVIYGIDSNGAYALLLTIQGINTGFGANADTRTAAGVAISRGLIRALHYGIVTGPASNQDDRLLGDSLSLSANLHKHASDLGHDTDTFMPGTWVKAMMLIRAINLSQGVSGVRSHIIENLITLVNQDLVPVVPLRGSISASGDLSPLSYIGGILQGKPVIKVILRSEEGQQKFISADKALQIAKIEPVDIGPKEGLAIVNGTAASAGIASLTIHEILSLSLLAQVLTAGQVESTAGSTECFSSFLSDIRPHRGQTECAANILRFLAGSKLITEFDDTSDALRQERYSTRTSPQWIGPVLEDIFLAYEQVVVEIDSVTDNPVIDPQSSRFIHGGNFQARSITTAMDKTRLACQTLGQMLFAQCTELINPHTSVGLPPNLVVDEPNESWMWKGTDIFIAALQAELGYLSSPTTHVQFAEQGNQAINSLALISARYTMTALDVLSQMMAAHVVAICQALDLRVLQMKFFKAFEPMLKESALEFLKANSKDNVTEEETKPLWIEFVGSIVATMHIPSGLRFEKALRGVSYTLLSWSQLNTIDQTLVMTWNKAMTTSACTVYQEVRKSHLQKPDTAEYLGASSKALYNFVRKSTGVPFFGEAYSVPAEWDSSKAQDNDPHYHHTMGEMITAVYCTIRSGALYAVLADVLKQTVSG